MAYTYKKGITKTVAQKLKTAKVMALSAVAMLSVAVGIAPHVSARGRASTPKSIAVVSCSAEGITFTVDTVNNDKINQVLLQADGSNVLVQAVARRSVVTIPYIGQANTRWSMYRQERDSWIPDYNTQIQADGTCSPNTWL